MIAHRRCRPTAIFAGVFRPNRSQTAGLTADACRFGSACPSAKDKAHAAVASDARRQITQSPSGPWSALTILGVWVTRWGSAPSESRSSHGIRTTSVRPAASTLFHCENVPSLGGDVER